MTISKIRPHHEIPACCSWWKERRVGEWNQVPALLGPPVGKRNVIPVQTTKAYTGRRGIVPLIDRGERYRTVVSLILQLFYPWKKKSPVPTEQEAWVDPRVGLDIL